MSSKLLGRIFVTVYLHLLQFTVFFLFFLSKWWIQYIFLLLFVLKTLILMYGMLQKVQQNDSTLTMNKTSSSRPSTSTDISGLDDGELEEILSKPSHSVPFKCDLYFILHDIISNVYNLHSPIYKKSKMANTECLHSTLESKRTFSGWERWGADLPTDSDESPTDDDDDDDNDSNSIANSKNKNKATRKKSKWKSKWPKQKDCYKFALILVEICQYVYSNNMEYELNNYKNNLKLIQNGLKLVPYIASNKIYVLPQIIGIIASYTLDIVESFKFNTKLCETERYKEQLTFNKDMDMVYFDHDREDFLVLLNENQIKCDTCIMRFDTLILGKGDEMWIGVIDEEAHSVILNDGGYGNGKWHNAIVYYGQRESTIRTSKRNGDIIRNAREYGQDVPYYREFDWISVIVNNIKKEIVFLKNNSVVGYVKDLPDNGRNLYFVCEVDTEIDGFFVQKYPLLLANVENENENEND